MIGCEGGKELLSAEAVPELTESLVLKACSEVSVLRKHYEITVIIYGKGIDRRKLFIIFRQRKDYTLTACVRKEPALTVKAEKSVSLPYICIFKAVVKSARCYILYHIIILFCFTAHL